MGYVPEMGRRAAIEKAAQLAGAGHILGALPRGLKTKLECSGYDAADGGFIHKTQSRERHGLSGGEVRHFSRSDPSYLISFSLIPSFRNSSGRG